MSQPKVSQHDIKTHTVIIYEDYVIIKPKSNNHMLIIGCPDSSREPDKYFETSVYIGNHGHLHIKSMHKGTIQLCLQSGEYPTELGFDETEGLFKRKSVYEMIPKKEL